MPVVVVVVAALRVVVVIVVVVGVVVAVTALSVLVTGDAVVAANRTVCRLPGRVELNEVLLHRSERSMSLADERKLRAAPLDLGSGMKVL